MNSPALSPDGKRLAVVMTTESTNDVWVKQLDTGPAMKLTFEGTDNSYPTWAPDGKSITFTSNSASPGDLWTKRADGTGSATRLLHYSRALAAGVWSADGKWLIARTAVSTEGSSDIFAMRAGVDSTLRPLFTTGFAETSPALSPDGRWLAYASDESGRGEVYVTSFPNVGESKWAISKNGGREPLWSHSGRELFFKTGQNLVSVPVQTKPTFSAGSPRILFSIRDYTANPNRQQHAISPDDKRFIFIRPIGRNRTQSIVFVENWAEELKRR